MSLKNTFFILLFAFSALGFSQKIELSPLSKISVITCGSGEELYSTFGHSAIRVQDPTQGVDWVYNYGTFDFTTPNFYIKFARGKLNYTLAKQSFPYFLRGYELENRWVKEQVLDLSLNERKALLQFLETNYLPDNRDYKYDFLFNNCATKIWEVLKEVYKEKLVLEENYLDELYTFRELIHQHLRTNSWSAFGIDLALGSVIDKEAAPKEHMFLPNYVMYQLDDSRLNGESLTTLPETLFNPEPKKSKRNFFFTPFFWMLALFTAVLIITYFDIKKNKRTRWLDFILFFTTGSVGCLIFFLWFFTDHTATAGNLNILWAFPLHLIIAFIIAQKAVPNWISKYMIFTMGLLVITAFIYILGIQVFSPLLIVVWLTLALRYLFLYWSYQKPKIA